MNKSAEITDGLYARLRYAGGQHARPYGLAKVPKKKTALRHVLYPVVLMRN